MTLRTDKMEKVPSVVPQISQNVINNIMEKEHITQFIEQNLNLIDQRIFPKFMYHNIIHALNTSLFAMVIASFYNISISEKKILLDASFLHDIGRISDGEDENHSYVSSILAETVITNQLFYQNQKNLLLLQSLILGHTESLYDQSIFEKSDSTDLSQNLLLLKILKDADILDRVRLPLENINLDRLNLEVSKSLLHFAKYVNQTKVMHYLIKDSEKYELSTHYN